MLFLKYVQIKLKNMGALHIMEQNVIRKVTFLHEFGKTKRKFQES